MLDNYLEQLKLGCPVILKIKFYFSLIFAQLLTMQKSFLAHTDSEVEDVIILLLKTWLL